MPTAFEVPANDLIDKLAKHLKENVSEISPPTWSEFAKTGAHKERPPQDPDWWYMRCASLLRKLYVHGPVATWVEETRPNTKPLQAGPQSGSRYSSFRKPT